MSLLSVDSSHFTSIRDKILEGMEGYVNDKEQVIIEATQRLKLQKTESTEFRGSSYRGPSKNRNKWQVMKMINKKKRYFWGTFSEATFWKRNYLRKVFRQIEVKADLKHDKMIISNKSVD